MVEFKGLLSALLNRNKTSAVTSLDSVTQMMRQLSAHDTASAHHTIRQTLKALNDDHNLPPKDRFKTLQLIDDQAQNIQQRIAEEALYDLAQQPRSSKQMIQTMLVFWQLLADGYRLVLHDIQRKGGKHLQDILPEIILRAMQGFAEQAKWKMVLYSPVDDSIWRNLDRLYLQAEQENVETHALQLHGKQVSCEALFLRPHLLSLSQPETLMPQQIDALDSWLTDNLSVLSLETEIQPLKQVYAINLEAHQPAHRLRRNMIDAGYRFLATQPLADALQATLTKLHEGTPPARLSLGTSFNVSTDIDALEKVIQCWSKSSYPSRKFDRKPINQPTIVKFGLKGIMHLMQDKYAEQTPAAPSVGYAILQRRGLGAPLTGKTDAPLFEDDTDQTRWHLQDESRSGIGIVADGEIPRGVKIGELVCLKRSNIYMLGVVRRIHKFNLLKIGIELFTHQARLVSIAHDTWPYPQEAIYLTEDKELGVPRSLLMPAMLGNSGQHYVLSSGNQRYRITLERDRSAHAGYQRFSFRVIEKLPVTG
ncbi:hypothetical protein [Leeia oryzae]|uniref:hypothetical protein n=1 Tax=Leeia oryzae TaxID=356662 RepID=UPI0003658294|nr:hypothetical protein [Leeia oryzae]